MSTDMNKFDDILKRRLHRDILFRVAIWGTISGIAAYYASHKHGFDAMEYFTKTANSITSLLNTIGVFALLLILPALMLKDLAHVDPTSWGYGSKNSLWSGFVRRLASDLTLWLIGAFVSLLACIIGVTTYSISAGKISFKEALAFLFMCVMIFSTVGIIGFLNMLVRRQRPPLTDTTPFSNFIKSPPYVFATYAGAAVILLWRFAAQS